MAEERDSIKLAQLLNCLSTSHSSQIVPKILEKEGNLNFVLPRNGFTALHCAAMKNNIDVFNILLEHGADYTLKDSDEETILTKLKPYNRNNLFIKSILCKHMEAKSCLNPKNKHGLSHFHVACEVNDLEAVKYFLRNGVAIDDGVSLFSHRSPGYTALHFAADNNNPSLVRILLEQGADVNISNGRKMTALHISIEKRIELFNKLRLTTCSVNSKVLQSELGKNEKIIKMIMENFSIIDSIGVSNLHAASMMQEFCAIENILKRFPDINQAINRDSHLWAGFTALHFAAYSSVEMVDFLIQRGANFEAQDLKKMTSLDICTQNYPIKKIETIFESNKKLKSITFSDNGIKLVDFIAALQNESSCEEFMKHSIKSDSYTISISKDAPLWPGFTILHLVVLFVKEPRKKYNPRGTYDGDIFFKLIKRCVQNEENLVTKNGLGQTPLHLAFRLGKVNIIYLILQLSLKIRDSIDNENLSHFHIITSLNKPEMLEISDTENSDVNIVFNGPLPIGPVQPGFTAFHVALKYREIYKLIDSVNVVKILLERGADCHKKDMDGLTPVHWLLSFPQAAAVCLAPYLLKNVENLVASKHNLSYLHIASFSNEKRAVERLLKNEVDLNMQIKVGGPKPYDPLRFLVRYSGFTPLLLNDCYFKIDVPALLIQKGANVFFKNDDEQFLPVPSAVVRAFFQILKQNIELQKDVELKFGISKLHLSCEEICYRKMKNLLSSGANINAQVEVSSPIWKGYTPLHVLMEKAKMAPTFNNLGSKMYNLIINALVLLLEEGADINIQNQEQESPIGIFFKFVLNDREQEIIDLLMQRVDYTMNPFNKQGISHFHMSCYLNNVVVVEKFLEKKIGIHQPIKSLSDKFAGASGLHLTSEQEIVNLLIKSGFDVNGEDSHGNTPLHKVAEHFPFDYAVFDELIQNGALINAENIYGQTPLEILLTKTTATFKNVAHVMQYGCSIISRNSIDNVAYLCIIISTKYTDNLIRDQLIEQLWDAPELNNSLSNGTLLYDLVSVSNPTFEVDDYTILIRKLIERGYDIDALNHEGKTALIESVRFGNTTGVKALLMCGADINIIDAFGKTLINYFNPIEDEQKISYIEIRKLVMEHIHKSKIFKLELNEINHQWFNSMKNTYPSDILDEASFLEHTCNLSKLEVNSIRVQEFLSKNGISIIYSPVVKSKRRLLIDQFIELIDRDNRFNLIKDILNLQYKKGITRSKLVFLAANSIKKVLGFNLPSLCAVNLFHFLTNVELQNVIHASIEN